MPKTPFLCMVRRALAASREAAPLASNETRGTTRSPLTRRSMLLGGVALGLHGVGCRASIPQGGALTGSVDNGGSVVIVGGGAAGLTCALRLLGGGIRAEVVEASNRLGGRMYSDRSTFGGLIVELGGEFIDTGHVHLRTLATVLGLELDDVKAAAAGLQPVFDFGGRIYEERDVGAALRLVAPLLARDAERIGNPSILSLAGRAFRELDGWSIGRWLQERGVTGLARQVIELAFTTEFGLYADELSCVPMLQMLNVGDSFALYGDSDERFHLRGGNERIPEALGKHVGGQVTLGAALESARRRPDGRIVLSFRRDASVFEKVADRVVFALPFTMLRRVALDPSLGLSAPKRQCIQELGYGTNAKLMLAYKTRKWRTAGRSGEVFSDRAFQSTWDTSRAQPGTDGILTVFSGGKSGLALGVGTSEAQRDSCAAAIDAALPGTRALRLAPPHARARQLLDVQGRSAFHLRRRRGCN